jgi:polar amino acid transport system substrate-binding protein
MQQLAQKLKDGTMKVIKVPTPALLAGTILVRNHYSLVSAGTEGSTVKTARKGFIGKAKERPQQVKQVLDVLKQQGPVQTYRAVMKKLDAHSPLGYSCAGEVIDMGPGVTEFKVGDKVACGGLTAAHAEIVSVPVRLCAKLDTDVDLSQAAYNTLGAIAMQGVRQADLRLGESCAVIGLGLLGQLTCLLLRASGIRTIGVDIDASMVDLAVKHCADLALTRDTAGAVERIEAFTGGIGCDAVIITAATDSPDPINFAGAIARKRGRVVVVGAVPTGFDREPHFYKKELEVCMSCSYGPGRYDPQYEEHGIDYPVSHVRWTEQRNMQAFQELIRTGAVDVGYLTTHTFKLDDAPAAYDMMMAKSEAFIGILIQYDTVKKIDNASILLSSKLKVQSSKENKVRIGFIGAGSYAQSNLLPNLKGVPKVSLKGVLTASGTSARSVAERFGFDFCAQDASDIIDNPDINTVFIATRHDSHAEYVLKALRAGKHVFVEKPPCLTEEELQAIRQAISPSTPRPLESSNPILMVGYNRRFAPMIQRIKQFVGEGPMAMTYRVNAGSIPADSWIQDPKIGGGRIVGEAGHFVDLLSFLNGSLPTRIHANAMQAPGDLLDTVTLSLQYANGSVGAIAYFANGDKKLSKERLEVFAHGCTAVLDDFKRLEIYKGGKLTKENQLNQDKGQKAEVAAFVQAILDGSGPPIGLDALFSTSLVTFKALESIASGQAIRL